MLKEISEMSLDEISTQNDVLGSLLYMVNEVGVKHSFTWNGLDYWDADRRHYKLSQELVLRPLIELAKQ